MNLEVLTITTLFKLTMTKTTILALHVTLPQSDSLPIILFISFFLSFPFLSFFFFFFWQDCRAPAPWLCHWVKYFTMLKI